MLVIMAFHRNVCQKVRPSGKYSVLDMPCSCLECFENKLLNLNVLQLAIGET